MIVWLASFPRSGNTFLRILLHRRYGITTSTVYERDGVADRLGNELVGYRPHTLSYEAMRASDSVYYIKTHRPCDELVDDADAAICLVRDGRDSIVSWSRQMAETPGRTYEDELRNLIMHPERRGAGCWGTNVLSWLQSAGPNRRVIRFDQLIADPAGTVAEAVDALNLGLSEASGIDGLTFDGSTFAELHVLDPAFFRVGEVGTHRTEMPGDLCEAFLAVDDNRRALAAAGLDE